MKRSLVADGRFLMLSHFVSLDSSHMDVCILFGYAYMRYDAKFYLLENVFRKRRTKYPLAKKKNSGEIACETLNLNFIPLESTSRNYFKNSINEKLKVVFLYFVFLF